MKGVRQLAIAMLSCLLVTIIEMIMWLKVVP